MAKRKNHRRASITTTVSDAAGRAIEQASQAGLDTLASEARSRRTAAVKTTKAALRQVQGAAARARRTAKALVKKVKKGVQKRVRQTQSVGAPRVARPVRRATSPTRKPANATGIKGTRALQAAHATRRTAHATSQNKRAQARRDRRS